jgi:hypothetical protein
VKDPATGTTYYSEKVDKDRRRVKLTDAKTEAPSPSRTLK